MDEDIEPAIGVLHKNFHALKSKIKRWGEAELRAAEEGNIWKMLNGIASAYKRIKTSFLDYDGEGAHPREKVLLKERDKQRNMLEEVADSKNWWQATIDDGGEW